MDQAVALTAATTWVAGPSGNSSIDKGEARMLSAEENELLTRVGPGTPVGDLIRQYWIPALMSSDQSLSLLGAQRHHLHIYGAAAGSPAAAGPRAEPPVRRANRDLDRTTGV